MTADPGDPTLSDWTLWRVPPGTLAGPDGLADGATAQWPMAAAGTVAQALVAAGETVRAREHADGIDIDAEEWWLTAQSEGSEGQPLSRLHLDGVGTAWDCYWDNAIAASGASMFLPADAVVDTSLGPHQLALRVRALRAEETPRRPRAAWRSLLVSDQSMRWHRTSGLGRIPWTGSVTPAGPWLPVRLAPADQPQVQLVATVDDGRPTLRVRVTPASASARPGDTDAGAAGTEPSPSEPATAEPATAEPATAEPATVRVTAGGQSAEAPLSGGPVELVLGLPDAPLWWPHTHGRPDLLDVQVSVGDRLVADRRVGFRTVEADRSDDGFGLSVNGIPVFARGATWTPPDPLDPAGTPESVHDRLRLWAEAGLNIVRVPGWLTWQADWFWDACDELGLLVWQDCMLHTLAPPDEEQWLAGLAAEAETQLARLTARPSLAVVSGGNETEQQPTLWGMPAERRSVPALDVLGEVSARVLPGVPFVSSSPTGGPLPTSISQGISHYFGVGAYRRPLEDARRARVRFAAECLAFANPPERASVRAAFGDAPTAEDPRWRLGVARDPAAEDWDFEDILGHYSRLVADEDLAGTWQRDPQRALDILRATSALAIGATLAEWRHPGSVCAGAIVLAGGDLAPGAGWGLIDLAGLPKSGWYAARRACAPLAVLVTDEGLDGPVVHIVNDRPQPVTATLEVEATLLATGAVDIQEARPVDVVAHDSVSVPVDELVGAFRDLTHAWAFGPQTYDTLTARLVAGDGSVLAESVALLGSQHRELVDEVGLRAEAVRAGDGWGVRVSAERTAAYLSIDLEEGRPEDSWFHLAAGSTRVVPVLGCADAPRGQVRALNASAAAEISAAAEA
ncbi:glycosyl hydrolase [Actinomycetota bacterium]